MSSTPYYPWFPGDFLAKTNHLSIEERGFYRDFLDALWLHNMELTKDDFRKIEGLTPKKFEKLWKKIEKFLQKKGEFWTQERIENSYKKLTKVSKINSENALKRWNSQEPPQTLVMRPHNQPESKNAKFASNKLDPDPDPDPNINTVVTEPVTPKPKRRVFKPPSIEEVREYMKEKGITNFTAEKWWFHYDQKSWYVGKTKMSKWKSSIALWARGDDLKKSPQQSFITNDQTSMVKGIRENERRLKELHG